MFTKKPMSTPTRRWRFSRYGVNLLAALALAFAPAVARGAVATTTLSVTANVAATCLISATAMTFGTYNGTLATSTATLSITCTNTTPYTLGLNPGVSNAATVSTRKMTANTQTLAYSLTSDAAYAVNWGQTVGTDTVAGTGTGAAQPLTVYGRIGAGQYVTPGAYTDTVTATVTF